jgi:hypothetical protein
METSNLKINLLNNIAVTYPELYQKLINLSAQVPNDVKVSLNDTLSKLHISDEKVELVLEKLINELTLIKNSINNKTIMLQESDHKNITPTNNILNSKYSPILPLKHFLSNYQEYHSNLGLNHQEHHPNLGLNHQEHHPNLGLNHQEHHPNLGLNHQEHHPNLGLNHQEHHPNLELNHQLLNEKQHLNQEQKTIIIELDKPITLTIHPECIHIEKFLDISDKVKSNFTIKNIILLLIILLLIYIFIMYRN